MESLRCDHLNLTLNVVPQVLQCLQPISIHTTFENAPHEEVWQVKSGDHGGHNPLEKILSSKRRLYFCNAVTGCVACRAILLEETTLQLLIIQLIHKRVADVHVNLCGPYLFKENVPDDPPSGNRTPNSDLQWVQWLLVVHMRILGSPHSGIL
jgi:hypothetical protein